MIVIPDNSCVNSSIFCATDIGTASVQYLEENHLATLELQCIIDHKNTNILVFLCHGPQVYGP